MEVVGWGVGVEREGKKKDCVQPLSGSAETLICMQYAPRRRKMKAAVPSSRTFQPFALGTCVGISINAGADIARIPLPSTQPHARLVSDVAGDE